MKRDLLNDPKLAEARDLFAQACAASRLHNSQTARAFANYGDHGPQISGCIRDHFPESVKEELRNLARLVTQRSQAAHDSRPKGYRKETMRKLARAVATRDGSGFYGPQPERGN